MQNEKPRSSEAKNSAPRKSAGVSKAAYEPPSEARLDRWADEFIENLNRNAKRGEPTS